MIHSWVHVLLLLIVVATAGTSGAAAAGEADPAALNRAAKLAEVLRCLVCQNQSIAESNAPLARDLKAQIVEQMERGRSDDEILDYMVARYGEFVLYRPPVTWATGLLWAGPFLVLIAGLIALGARLSRNHKECQAELSADERARAAELLGIDGERAQS